MEIFLLENETEHILLLVQSKDSDYIKQFTFNSIQYLGVASADLGVGEMTLGRFLKLSLATLVVLQGGILGYQEIPITSITLNK